MHWIWIHIIQGWHRIGNTELCRFPNCIPSHAFSCIMNNIKYFSYFFYNALISLWHILPHLNPFCKMAQISSQNHCKKCNNNNKKSYKFHQSFSCRKTGVAWFIRNEFGLTFVEGEQHLTNILYYPFIPECVHEYASSWAN